MKTHQFLTNIENGTKVVSIVVIGIVVFKQHDITHNILNKVFSMFHFLNKTLIQKPKENKTNKECF